MRSEIQRETERERERDRDTREREEEEEEEEEERESTMMTRSKTRKVEEQVGRPKRTSGLVWQPIKFAHGLMEEFLGQVRVES